MKSLSFGNRSAGLTAVLTGLLATNSMAALLVPNSSFESPDVDFGFVTPTSWSQFTSNNQIFDAFGTLGPDIPSGFTGTQVDVLNDNNPGASNPTEATDLYVSIGSPDNNLLSLTMTVDAASRNNAVAAAPFTYGIWLDLIGGDGIPDTPLATTPITPATILPTGFTTQAPVVTGPVLAGTQLYARFQVIDVDNVTLRQTLLDNVQLFQVAQVPEPSSILLMAIGALLVWRRRAGK